jgi:hypothetical protein
MGIELSTRARSARIVGNLRVTNVRRTLCWLRIQRYTQKHPAFKQGWFDAFEEAVATITETVKNAVNKGDTQAEVDLKSPVPHGMHPIEAGTVFAWRAQLVAQKRLGRMLETGELDRPVELGFK